MFVKCVGPSNVVGCPLFTKRSNEKMNDIMKRNMKTNRLFLCLKNISPLYHLGIFFAFSLLVFLLFFLINPKYSPIFLPLKRTKMITSFLESTEKQSTINPQEFWSLREFYSPGLLMINKDATSKPFLIFTSDKIKSYESLVAKYNINRKWPPVNLEGKRVDYLTESELIYRENNMMRIIFLKPISQMITANAVYDYKDKDKIFLEKKLWFVDSTIDLR